MMSISKRIETEIKNLNKSDGDLAESGIKIVPRADNLRYFDITIPGPKESPYEGGVFELEMFLPEDYPLSPPLVYFVTKIYHPNVDAIGRICLDTLADKWTPIYQIPKVVLCVYLLMQSPNPDDPLDYNIAELWRTNEAMALKNARVWTQRYATLTKSHYAIRH